MGHLPHKAARLLCALIAASALAAPATAGDRHERPRSYDCRLPVPACEAGTLVIDGRRYAIDGDRVHRSLVRALRDAGLRAWIDDGRVVARFDRGCRPRIWWSSGTHGASIRFHGDCVSVHVRPIACEPVVRAPYKPACEPRPRWPRSSRWCR